MLRVTDAVFRARNIFMFLRIRYRKRRNVATHGRHLRAASSPPQHVRGLSGRPKTPTCCVSVNLAEARIRSWILSFSGLVS